MRIWYNVFDTYATFCLTAKSRTSHPCGELNLEELNVAYNDANQVSYIASSRFHYFYCLGCKANTDVMGLLNWL